MNALSKRADTLVHCAESGGKYLPALGLDSCFRAVWAGKPVMQVDMGPENGREYQKQPSLGKRSEVKTCSVPIADPPSLLFQPSSSLILPQFIQIAHLS